MMQAERLARIERYYDAVPRAAARIEDIGPFTLFVRTDGGWPYYARPALGATHFTTADVERVRARQRELGVPEQFEWVAEITPALGQAAASAGLAVHSHPLLVLPAAAYRPVSPPPDVRLRLVQPDDDLGQIGAVADLAFGNPGTSIGLAGLADLAAAPRRAASIESQRERLRSGRTVSAVALVQTAQGEYPVATGSHQPLDGVSEVVGVATLPAFRRRGLGAAVTSLLTQDALRRGCAIVFLSADDEAVARVYTRVGFQPLAQACIAEPPH